MTPNDFGSFHGKFDIALDAPLDRYRVSIEFPRANGGYYSYGESLRILIAEYRLPEYQLSLNTRKPEIVKGETANFELKGNYFFGGPVSNADGEYTVYAISLPLRLQGRRILRFRRS